MNSRTLLRGMQYRSMHTVGRQVAISRDRRKARELEHRSSEHGTIADVEISFRRPPLEYRKAALFNVNVRAVALDGSGGR
jgi:hypothetical protein